jgi:hypothetical protein
MSVLTVQPLRDAIRTACVTAFAITADDVTYGNPRVVEPTLPYVVVRLDTVPMQVEAVTSVEQTYLFEITFVGQWGPDEVIEDIKVEKANALISELMTGALFAGIAYNPMIMQVDFAESDDPNEPTYELTVLFSVSIEQQRLV